MKVLNVSADSVDSLKGLKFTLLKFNCKLVMRFSHSMNSKPFSLRIVDYFVLVSVAWLRGSAVRVCMYGNSHGNKML